MQQEIRIHIMQCGEVGVDPAVPARDVSENPLAYTGIFRSAKRRIWMPVFAYLLVHPQGNILVDTGWSSEVRLQPQRAEGRPLFFVTKPRLPAGSAVDEQLLQRRIRPEQLNYVFLTHMDVDHVNGIQMVKPARHIMASGDEIRQANRWSLRYRRKQWAGIRIEPIPFQQTAEGVAGKAFDVFGDGTIQVLLTPGHSAGAVTLLVRNHGKAVLLAGDTGYAASSWREGRLPGPVYDKRAMRQALDWVKRLEKAGCLILASHDPAIAPKEIVL